jgi:nucleotide-binding universal stress UspA family protein
MEVDRNGLEVLGRGDPSSALLRAGEEADLLVVGSRGLGVNGEAEPGSARIRRDVEPVRAGKTGTEG